MTLPLVYIFNFLNSKSNSEVVKCFLQLYSDPGDSRDLAVSLAAPTRPEAVRISGGVPEWPIYLFLRLKNVEPEVPTTV